MDVDEARALLNWFHSRDELLPVEHEGAWHEAVEMYTRVVRGEDASELISRLTAIRDAFEAEHRALLAREDARRAAGLPPWTDTSGESPITLWADVLKPKSVESWGSLRPAADP